MARYSRLLVCFTVALLALTLLGCGGSSAPIAPPPADPQAVASPRTPLSAQQRAILQQRAARVLPPQAIAALERIGMPVVAPSHTGKRAAVFLPYVFGATQQYTAGDAGYIGNSADVSFSAFDVTMAPPSSAFPDSFSYVMYRVDDIVGQLPGQLGVSINSVPGQDIGVAAYNWAYGSLGRWEALYYGPVAAQLNVDLTPVAGANWMNAGDDLVFVLFTLNPNSVTVDALSVAEAPANQWPIAEIQALPSGGPAPLDVTLDASASFDLDGSIVNYRFDPLGDGNWVDNGASALFPQTYATPGAYDALVEVTDDDGAVSTWQTSVIVHAGVYDEVEDNDSVATANSLPALPFSSFVGSAGPDGTYDGDIRDLFTFSANAGDEVSFLVRYSNSGGTDFSVSLEDAFGAPLAQSFGYPPQPLSYTFQGFESAPYILRIECGAGGSDYLISGTDAAYDELENNDDPPTANYLGDLVSLHELIDYSASLGDNPPAYEGYDGDNDDWYTFDAPAGSDFTLSATYDNSAGANIGVSLLDGGLNVLDSSADGDGQEDLAYTFTGAEPTPFFLQFHCTASGSDYLVNATVAIVNPGFDEQENNDDEFAPNDLGTLPVTGFTGNVGPSGSYDGDLDDWFSLDASVGEMVRVTITPDNQFAFLSVTLTDSSHNFRVVGGSEWDPGTGIVTAYIQARTSDIAPYLIGISNSGVETDYSIDAEVITDFDEVEDNDDNAGANPLADFFQYFSGNLGAGGYDGDTLDNYTFDAQQNTGPSFQVFFDETTGATPTLTIRDSEGDIISDSFEDSPGVWTVYLPNLLDADDVAPYYLEVQMSGGTTNYWISRNDMVP
jgi:hypothetical protein